MRKNSIMIIFFIIYLISCKKGKNIIQSSEQYSDIPIPFEKNLDGLVFFHEKIDTPVIYDRAAIIPKKKIISGLIIKSNTLNPSFGIAADGKINFYEWNGDQEKWEHRTEFDFDLPIGYKNIFLFSGGRPGWRNLTLAIEFENDILFFDYVENEWVKKYRWEDWWNNKGTILGDYDFSIPENSKVLFVEGDEIWIKNNSKITVYIYNDDQWDLYTNYDLSAIDDYETFIPYIGTYFLGAVKNLNLDFFRLENSRRGSYIMFPNSNFMLPEGFENVNITGIYLKVIIENKIKFYRVIGKEASFGIETIEGWEYVEKLDFNLN
jgi:hypothetical protein